MFSKSKPSLSKSPFIAFVGVMGVGKSTLAEALAKKLNAKCWLEPGADAWPIDPNQWEQHVFILEQWVRQTNLSAFKEAHHSAANGKAAISDGALFLVAKDCIDDPSCQFYYGLLNENEKQILRKECLEDRNEAPCPDILILLETDIETWKQFLDARGRKMDDNREFIAHYVPQQKVIRDSAQKYAQEKQITLLTFDNRCSSIAENIERLHVEVENLIK